MNTVKGYVTILQPLSQMDYVRRCNTLNNLSNKTCVLNKTRFKVKRNQHDYKNN